MHGHVPLVFRFLGFIVQEHRSHHRPADLTEKFCNFQSCAVSDAMIMVRCQAREHVLPKTLHEKKRLGEGWMVQYVKPASRTVKVGVGPARERELLANAHKTEKCQGLEAPSPARLAQCCVAAGYCVSYGNSRFSGFQKSPHNRSLRPGGESHVDRVDAIQRPPTSSK